MTIKKTHLVLVKLFGSSNITKVHEVGGYYFMDWGQDNLKHISKEEFQKYSAAFDEKFPQIPFNGDC